MLILLYIHLRNECANIAAIGQPYLFLTDTCCVTNLLIIAVQCSHSSVYFETAFEHWRIQEFEKGGHMASAKREPIMGVWGFAPSGVQGQSPWLEGQGASPPEAERIYIING